MKQMSFPQTSKIKTKKARQGGPTSGIRPQAAAQFRKSLCPGGPEIIALSPEMLSRPAAHARESLSARTGWRVPVLHIQRRQAAWPMEPPSAPSEKTAEITRSLCHQIKQQEPNSIAEALKIKLSLNHRPSRESRTHTVNPNGVNAA